MNEYELLGKIILTVAISAGSILVVVQLIKPLNKRK